MLFLVGLYLLVSAGLYRWMKNRPPINTIRQRITFRRVIMIINIISLSYIGLHVVNDLIQRGWYDVLCHDTENYYKVGSAIVTIKIIYFYESFLIILAKQPLEWYHFYHHASALYFSWLILKSQTTLGPMLAWINMFAQLRLFPYLQIVQFVAGMILCTIILTYHRLELPCVNQEYSFIMGIYTSYLILYLFHRFQRV